MQRARVLTRTDVVLPEHLPPSIRQAKGDVGNAAKFDTESQDPEESILPTLRECEIESLRRALEVTDGTRTKAAELLGITRRGLLKKLRRFGI